MKKAIFLQCHIDSEIDYDWLKVCLKSYRRCVPDGDIYLVEDNLKLNQIEFIENIFNVDITHIDKSEWEGRRMLCRMEQFIKILDRLDSGIQLIQSDIDILFLRDPYTAYDGFEYSLDIGITPRLYRYEIPINAGMVFYRTSNTLLAYAKWAVQVVQDLSWTWYKEVMSSRDNIDWGCDQDFLYAVCTPVGKSHIGRKFRLFVQEVGYQYNCCIGSDVLGDDEAIHLMRYLYETKKYPVLHFKGQRMKKLIYEFNLGDSYG